MAEKDLSELFVDTLKDIYYAEKQIYKSLPKMAKAANSDQLRAAFEKHHDETEGQIERLETIFKLLGKPARGKKCDAIEGILDEGKEVTSPSTAKAETTMPPTRKRTTYSLISISSKASTAGRRTRKRQSLAVPGGGDWSRALGIPWDLQEWA
jgi:hypothetical protein